MDIQEKLTRHTCGELSCDECNAERNAASAEIARLRESLQSMAEYAAELERANTTGAERLRFVLEINARLREALKSLHAITEASAEYGLSDTAGNLDEWFREHRDLFLPNDAISQPDAKPTNT